MNGLATTSRSDSYHQALAIIEAADLADSTKVKYRRVLECYLDEGHPLTDSAQLARFATSLSNSRRAQLKAAVKLWSDAMIVQAKSMASPDNIDTVNAAIYRFQALQTAVTVKTAKGEKVHTWLSQAEVSALMSAVTGGSNRDWRDRVGLALLVGAGLRRAEAVEMEFAHVRQQPIRKKVRSVLEVRGKGAKDRVVPISDELARMLETWRGKCGNGRILRSVRKNDAIGESLSDIGLFGIVRQYGGLIGHPELDPHDLRRTYAQIGFENGVPLTQMSKLLGHSSVATTQRYLNLDLNLEVTASDFVRL